MEGLPDWPTNWLTSRLAGWLAGWLGDWLTFWQAGELSAPISLSLFTLFYVTFWFPLHTRSVKMGNLVGIMCCYFRNGGSKLQNFCNQRVHLWKLQRDDGCSRRLITQCIPSAMGEYLSLLEPIISQDLSGTTRWRIERKIKEVVSISFDQYFSNSWISRKTY